VTWPPDGGGTNPVDRVAAPVLPSRPGRRGGPAAPISGRYKVAPEDFEVEELPAYEPSGEGEHAWLWIEKRGIATMDLLPHLARALDLRVGEIGYAGLKDAQAVTRQWLSVPAACEARCDAIVDLSEQLGSHGDGGDSGRRVAVLRRTRHGNKLKMGHLRGNRFRIVLRDSRPEERDAAALLLLDLSRRGVPNGFGEQRFGNRGGNLEKGLQILRGHRPKSLPKRILRLMVASVQSEVFNRVLALRLESLDTLEDGDVACLHRNGACFVVADAALEQPRCSAFELSPTGPLPGPRALVAEGAQGAREAEVMAELGVDTRDFGAVPHKLAPGERRPLRVPLWEPQVDVVDGCLALSFGLPRGSYATAVLREVLAEAPWFDASARAPQ